MNIQNFFIYSFLLFTLLFATVSHGQNKVHLIYFKDKSNSPYSLNNPAEFLTQKSIQRRKKQNIPIQTRDLPVNPDYIQTIKNTGAKILFPTRWFNGLLIETDEVTLSEIQKLDIIKNTELLSKAINSDSDLVDNFQMNQKMNQNKNGKRNGRLETEDYGESLIQTQLLGLDKMHQAGFHGEGMTIAVLDNGFQNVDINPAFEHLDILGTYDFVGQQENVFGGGTHGVNALSVLGAYQPGDLIGGAYAASYYLFETENNQAENRAEEAFWLVAVERADSLGVDIISTSLGYYHFDDPTTDYSPEDADGNTTLITRAADMAVGTGMIVITSAGNVNSSWKTMTFPADGDSVLAVGSVNEDGSHHSNSVTGYSVDGRVKPDVVAMGHNTVVINESGFRANKTGTSFACPAVAALAAGLWQSQPELTAMEVVKLIQKSGSQYRSPDDKLGYGIPSFERATKSVLGVDQVEDSSSNREVIVYPNPTDDVIYLDFGDFYQNKNLKIILRKTDGQELYTKTLFLRQKRLKFQLSDLDFATGIYFLNIQVGDFVKLLRIVKQ